MYKHNCGFFHFSPNSAMWKQIQCKLQSFPLESAPSQQLNRALTSPKKLTVARRQEDNYWPKDEHTPSQWRKRGHRLLNTCIMQFTLGTSQQKVATIIVELFLAVLGKQREINKHPLKDTALSLSCKRLWKVNKNSDPTKTKARSELIWKK